MKMSLRQRKQSTFILTDYHQRLLDRISKVEELNKSEIIRQLIEKQWGSTRIRHQVEDIEDER